MEHRKSGFWLTCGVYALAASTAGCALSTEPDGDGVDQSRSAESLVASAAPPVIGKAPTPKSRGERAPLGDVTITWKTAPKTTLSARQSVVALLGNPTKRAVAGQLYLVASGLDGQLVRNSFGTIQLAPGATRTLNVPLSSLPLQSDTSTSFLAIEAEVKRPTGPNVHYSSLPLYYQFTAGYGQATFYEASDVPSLPGGGANASAQLAASGRIVTEGGNTQLFDRAVERAAGVAMPGGQALGATSVQLMSEAEVNARNSAPQLGASENAVATAAAGRVNMSLCAYWRVFYTDSGYGEDIYSQTGWRDVPAVGAKVEVMQNSTTVWSGNLGSFGCKAVSLADGTYTFVQHTTNMTLGSAKFNVWYVVADGSAHDASLSQNFTVDSNTTVQAANFRPTYNHESIQAVGVASTMLVAAQTPKRAIPLGLYTYNIKAPRGCSGITPPTDSCYDPSTDTVHIGTTVIGTTGQPDSHWKYIVAHEIGHNIEDKWIGDFHSTYGDNTTTVPQCRCDHYSTNWSNQEHCMQSREQMGAAQMEAFGHAVATRTFNDDSSFGGPPVFVYYKPFLGVDDDGNPELTNPPVAFGLSSSSSPRWMATACPSGATHKGVEYDWLSFFQRISNTVTANPTSLGNMLGIYIRACNSDDGECSSSQDLSWAQIQSAAQAYWGGAATEPHYVRFRDTASSAGVNY